MNQSNTVAHQLESYGVRTFSAKEMAFNILGLMHPLLFSITQVEPIWADLNGGMDRLPDLADITVKIRNELNAESSVRKSVTRDSAADYKVVNGPDAEVVLKSVPVTPRANFKFDFPKLESPQSLADLAQLQGMVDLDKVIVIAGFAEVGPWGSARTRWEMEARGEFTIEGCIEMAWIMGLIKHFDGKLKTGNLHVGWVDAKSGEPVDDKDIKAKYEKEVLAHSGIRLIGNFLIPMTSLKFYIDFNSVQNPSFSKAMIQRGRVLTKRLSLHTISKLWRCPLKKLTNSSFSMVRNAMLGLSLLANGLFASRRVLASLSPRLCLSVDLSLVNFPLAGTQADMASLPILSLRLTELLCGRWSALPRRLSWLASTILMSSTSTCILRRLVRVSVVGWVGWSRSPPCSVIGMFLGHNSFIILTRMP
jgi:hypothetical protein